MGDGGLQVQHTEKPENLEFFLSGFWSEVSTYVLELTYSVTLLLRQERYHSFVTGEASLLMIWSLMCWRLLSILFFFY